MITQDEINGLCSPILGKKVVYKNKLTTFEGYSVMTKQVNVSFSDEVIAVDKDIFEAFILQITTDEVTIKPKTNGVKTTMTVFEEEAQDIQIKQEIAHRTVKNTVIGRSAQSLADIIESNIKKLQEDKNYIGQAEAINNQLKSLIELGKTEIEMLKVSHLLSNGRS